MLVLELSATLLEVVAEDVTYATVVVGPKEEVGVLDVDSDEELEELEELVVRVVRSVEEVEDEVVEVEVDDVVVDVFLVDVGVLGFRVVVGLVLGVVLAGLGEVLPLPEDPLPEEGFVLVPPPESVPSVGVSLPLFPSKRRRTSPSTFCAFSTMRRMYEASLSSSPCRATGRARDCRLPSRRLCRSRRRLLLSVLSVMADVM